MSIQARYQKAKVLAEQGATEGERAAAQAAVLRMETEHPDLKQMKATPLARPGIAIARYWN